MLARASRLADPNGLVELSDVLSDTGRRDTELFLPATQLTGGYGVRWVEIGSARLLVFNDLPSIDAILSLKFALCALQRWVKRDQGSRRRALL